MKRILLMLLAVFAIGGGNLWATDTTVDINKRLTLSGGTATITDASLYEVKMDGWQNFVIFDNSEGVAIDGTSTIVVGMTEKNENGSVRTTITFAPDEGEDFNVEFWWCLGVGNDINDTNTYYGHAFDGATWYFKKGAHEELKNRGYYDSETDTYSVKVKKVTINNFNAGAQTYLLSGEGNVASAPLNISKGSANSYGALNGSFTVPGIYNAAFKFENLDVKNYHTLRIEFEEALSDGWSFFIGTEPWMNPNSHMNGNVYELNIDDLKTIDGESETLKELTLLRSSDGAATAKIKSITLYGEETITVNGVRAEMFVDGNFYHSFDSEHVTEYNGMNIRFHQNYAQAGWNCEPTDMTGYNYFVVVFNEPFAGGKMEIQLQNGSTDYKHDLVSGKDWMVIDFSKPFADNLECTKFDKFKCLRFWNGWGDADKTLDLISVYFSVNNPLRTVTAGRFGTICLPHAVKLHGATAYAITGKTADALYISEVGTDLEAGTPYFYLPTGNEMFVQEIPADEVDVQSANGLVGTYTSITAPKGDDYYVLSNNTLYNVDADANVTIGANKAYIDLSQISSGVGSASARIPFFGEETNAIDNISNSFGDSKVYDLNGRAVTRMQKGNIYIMNGMKVIVK